MQGSSLAKRLADNWPIGLAVATGLAFLPLANWLGVVLATLIVLRQGGVLASFGYALVSVVTYFTLTRYSLSLLTQEWGAVVVIFAPLWVMAWLLRGLRSLTLALAGGTLAFMTLILLIRLIEGPPNLDVWVAFFECRLKASGLTENQLAHIVPKGQSFRDVVQAFMIAWPLTISLLQMGLLFAARWAQAKAYYPGGFQRDFHSLKLPQPLALGGAGLLVMAAFAPESMVTLIHLGILALVLLGITGLGVFHGYVAVKRWSGWWLVLAYALGLLLLGLWGALMALAALAVLDSCFNFKLRER